MLQKLQNILRRLAPLTIYKCFIRPHLDSGDIIYDQAYNLSFHHKLESIQYNAALALTGQLEQLKEKVVSTANVDNNCFNANNCFNDGIGNYTVFPGQLDQLKGKVVSTARFKVSSVAMMV